MSKCCSILHPKRAVAKCIDIVQWKNTVVNYVVEFTGIAAFIQTLFRILSGLLYAGFLRGDLS